MLLPTSVDCAYLPSEKRNFLRKHDAATRSLYFLWQAESEDAATRLDCGCAGNCRFFVIEGEDEKPQYGYMQSIIERDAA